MGLVVKRKSLSRLHMLTPVDVDKGLVADSKKNPSKLGNQVIEKPQKKEGTCGGVIASQRFTVKDAPQFM